MIEHVLMQEVSLVEVFTLVDEPDVAFDLESARQANSYANGGLLPNVATVTTTDELGEPGPSATAEELVRVVALKDVNTGFDQGLLLPLMVMGMLVLFLNRRFGLDR